MTRQAVAAGFLAAALISAAPGAQTGFDLIIRGGQVVDGSGAAPRAADVGIRGDSIAEVGDLAAARAATIVDARGLVVAPGFIDMHSHSEFPLLVDGRALSKVTQGVTTELLGESDSAAPATGPARADKETALGDLGLRLDWTGFDGYFARLERGGTSVNVVSTVGSGTVRAAVVGFDNRPATPEELGRMEALVEQAMADGAAGLSSGLIYPPNSYASTDELIALAKVAARHGGIYVSHIRNEAAGLLDALGEAIRIGREAGLPVEVLHIKRNAVTTDGRAEQATMRDAVALIERAQRDGVRIYADVYPYAASSTTLNTRIPQWALEGGTERLLARLRDPAARKKILGEIATALSGRIASSTPGTIMLSRTPHAPHRAFQGKRINEIADEMGTSPAEAIVRLVEQAGGRAGAIYFGMREEDVEFALTRPWTTIGSDGSALAPDGILAQSSPHPRSYGTFPRVLRQYVREKRSLLLEEAIKKMTSLSASRLGLRDRGTLAPGMKADVVVFDAATITDRATFENPHQLSTGVRWLVVNGQVVLADGTHTGAKPGRVLRRAERAASSK